MLNGFAIKGCAWLLCLLLLISHRSYANEKPLTFTRLTPDDGLTIGFVTDIVRDQQGFMWFAGFTALARFDGYEYKIYQSSADDPNSINANLIWELEIDKAGVLWIRTAAGLARYNADQDNFSSIDLRGDSANEVHLVTLDLDHQGNLLVLTSQGLMQQDSANGDFRVIKSGPGFDGARAIAPASDGKYWVVSDASGLVLWDPYKDSVIEYPHDPKNPNSMVGGGVVVVLESDQGDVYFGGYAGFGVFHRKTGSFTHYHHDASDPKSLGANVVADVLEDHQGNIWVATDGGGLNRFKPETQDFDRYTHDGFNQKSLNSNVVKSIFEDPYGDLWVGMYPNGVNHSNKLLNVVSNYRHHPLQPFSLSNNDVGTLAEDEQGNFWIGTGGGLNYFDRKSGKFHHYLNEPKEPGTLTNGAVMKVYYDSQQRLWAATWSDGLHLLKQGASEFKTYRPVSNDETSIPHVNAWGMMEDSKGNMWFGTEYGIARYVDKTDSFERIVHDPNDRNSLVANFVWWLYEDSKGMIWAGTTGGLCQFDPKTMQFTNYYYEDGKPGTLSHNSVVSVIEDSKNRMWFGTDNGLNLYDREKGNFKTISINDGLADVFVKSILEDDKGNLWLTSTKGVTKYNPDTLDTQVFKKDSGLQGNDFSFGAIKTKNGELVFGGRNGFSVFKPEKLMGNAIVPQVQFTELSIANNPVKIGLEDSPLASAINYTDHITFTAKQPIFSFKFSAISYRNPAANTYAYMLEGFEKDWQYTENLRIATYTNLNAGEYTLKVKAANEAGVWSKENATMSIKVLPPWYKTWWAYTLYVIAVLSQILRVIYSQYRKRQIVEEQNRLLEVKVAERTAALREKNNDIQAMLGNIPQGLFTVVDGCVIHPEYSAYLETIFETNNIANTNVNELLFRGAKLGADVLNSNEVAIQSIVNEDVMNFDFNVNLLVNEYELIVSGKTKHLSLDWNPIVQDDVVEKLMISVRDVTQLRKMENEAREQKRQLEIIGQLLKISEEKYLGFKESAINYLNKNREVVDLCETPDADTLALLFRNMHTIKGNCRTFKFTYMSDIVHEVESTYSALREMDEISWDKDQLLDDISRVERVVTEYDHVFSQILGRGVDSHKDKYHGFWLKSSVMERIKELIDTGDLAELNHVVNKVYSSSIEEALVNVIASLSSIASQLGKKTPIVNIASPNIRVKNTSVELLNDVFSHILRNSIDHGIEPEVERLEAGKNLKGNIMIVAVEEGDFVKISIQDDGRGLNLDKLLEKAIANGVCDNQQNLSDVDIAQLIFKSGISTKDAVTDISGRGVGMDAVKQFIVSQGGSVHLALHREEKNVSGYLDFSLIIKLPLSLFVLGPNQS